MESNCIKLKLDPYVSQRNLAFCTMLLMVIFAEIIENWCPPRS